VSVATRVLRSCWLSRLTIRYSISPGEGGGDLCRPSSSGLELSHLDGLAPWKIAIDREARCQGPGFQRS
jgi:hypothetical protein